MVRRQNPSMKLRAQAQNFRPSSTWTSERVGCPRTVVCVRQGLILTNSLDKSRLFILIKSDSRQTCLSIITLYSGMEQAFFIDSFTSSFINCGFGPEWIGYIMIFYGVGNSLFSFIWGYLDGKLGRVFVFISGFILNLGMFSY